MSIRRWGKGEDEGAPGRDGRVVGDLLGDVVRDGTVRVVVPTAEELANYRVVPIHVQREPSALPAFPPTRKDGRRTAS